jgi:cyclomaltodextrinase
MKKLAAIILSIILISSCSSPQKTDLFDLPGWAKEAVWYQIFPERFANGDLNNDPQPIDMEGAWPYFTPEGWQIHPWNSDWYKLQPWEAKLNKNFYDLVNIRRYGGDLQGVIAKLDYLKELGITSLYLNPIFESPSLHKYDATFYHHIDNNFGPDPDGDREIWAKENHADPTTWKWSSADKLFLKLIEEVHKRGMKIIIDGVFNHTGTQFWAFKDIVKNQEKSQFKDWFIINKWDDPATPESEFQYAGWMGVRDLPEIKEDENGLVTGPREHVHAVVKRWMDPNGDGDPSDGIDGWRLDVAEMVNHNFWKDFRKWVREINSDAYIVGEVWWEDWNNYKMFDAKPWLGDQFDAVMNYRFTRAIKDFVLADKVKIDTEAFTDTIKKIMSNYGENYFVMMNLLGSHDTERLASLAVNPDGRYDHQGNVRDNRNFDIRKPNEEEMRRIKLSYGIQFSMPGAPQIYYGDEAGMWGGDDPDCRKPMVWPDETYEDETVHPFGIKRILDKVKFNDELFNWIKNLARIRNDNRALSLGTIDFDIIDNDASVLSYRRKLENDEVLVVVNRNPVEVEINSISVKFLESKADWEDLITGVKISKGNSIVKLDPYQILILK